MANFSFVCIFSRYYNYYTRLETAQLSQYMASRKSKSTTTTTTWGKSIHLLHIVRYQD